MLTLKISYKGKTFVAPKGTDSLAKIQQELVSRFPGEFIHGALINFNGNRMNDFQQIQDAASTLGVKSIKVQAEQAPQKIQSAVEEVKKVEETQKTEQNHVEIKVQEKMPEPEAEPEIQPIARIIAEPEKPTQILPAVQPKNQPEQPKVEEPAEQKPKPVEEPKKQESDIQNEAVLEDEIEIDSMSSQLEIDNQKLEEQNKYEVNGEEVEVKVESDYKPEIIKCALFGDGPKQQINPDQVKCTITNTNQKQENQQNQPQPQPQQEQPEFPKNLHHKKSSQIIQKQPQPQHHDQPQHPISIIQPKSEIPQYISQIKNQINPNSLIQISPGVYKCMFCCAFQDCKICDSRRMLNQDSKIIKMINCIVDKKVEEKLCGFVKEFSERFEKFEKLMMKVKEEEKQEKKEKKEKRIFKEQAKQEKKVDIDSELMQKQIQEIKNSVVEIEDGENKKQAYLGEQVSWKFNIKIKKQLAYRHKICLIEQRTGQLIFVQLTNNIFIEVGPYKPASQGKFQKTYRLCLFRQDQSMQLFGPKFGFTMSIQNKDKPKKVLSNTIRQKIDQIKKAYKIEKSTQYLIEKLKEININEQNFEQMKDMIPDIFAAL